MLDCDYGFDWTTLSFNVSRYSRLLAEFPKEADYVELLFGVVRFDFITRSYGQVLGATLIIRRDFTGDQFMVEVSGLPEVTSHFIALAGVSFYQTVNGEVYLLPGGSAFGLEVVGML